MKSTLAPVVLAVALVLGGCAGAPGVPAGSSSISRPMSDTNPATPADARERDRQLRFLLGRGFDAELARRVIRRGGVSEDDDACARAVDTTPTDHKDCTDRTDRAGSRKPLPR